MAQHQQSLTVNITSVRFEEAQAIVDFVLLPGGIQISMPVATSPGDRFAPDIFVRAWANLAVYLRQWAEVATDKGSSPLSHLRWGG